jgi:hypothetical protein
MRWSFCKNLAYAAFVIGAAAAGSVPAVAQEEKRERVKFDTADFVELHGSFYVGGAGAKSACVMLVHQVGGSSEQEGWGDLAKKLQDKGFSVLTFDLRGHGDSTTVAPGFWKVPRNQTLSSYRAGKQKDQISYKDFRTLDQYASMVDDLAAAKRFLDRRNDAGDCNSSNVIVVGAQSGAALGLLWTYCAWHTVPYYSAFQLLQGTRQQVEGQDICAAVWLSISPYLGPGGRGHVSLENWVRAPVRERVPMYFLYGEHDSKSANVAHILCDKVMRAEKDSKTKWTGKKALKETKLAGSDLLGNSLQTKEDIITYVTKVMDEHAFSPAIKREVDRAQLRPIPVEQYLR